MNTPQQPTSLSTASSTNCGRQPGQPDPPLTSSERWLMVYIVALILGCIGVVVWAIVTG